VDAKAQHKYQSPPASMRAEKPRKKQKEIECTALVSLTSPPSDGPHQHFSNAFDLDFRLPPDFRSLVATAADRQYLGCFLSSNPNSIITPLVFHCSTTPSFRFAVRAGTMAFYGKMTSDLVLQRESSVWYEKALQVQLAILSRMDRLSSDNDSRLPTTEDVLTPLMLGVYESALCTSPMGWVHHLSAGAAMLEKLGPERCQSGDLHSVLRGVRNNMVSLLYRPIGILADQIFPSQVYISATVGKPSIFASEEWCNIPFALTRKSALDQLVDILLWIPHMMDTRSQWAEVKDTILPEAEMLRQQLIIQVEETVDRLSEWWTSHGPAIFDDYDYAHYVQDWNWTPPEFHDATVATTIAFYNTASIFLQHLQRIGLGMSTEHQLTMHASSVLAAARFHQSRGPQSGGTFMMVYPLKSVCMMTPDEEQRREAQEILLEWGMERGIEGTCRVAAPQYSDNRSKE
jgi:hypothetical protein